METPKKQTKPKKESTLMTMAIPTELFVDLVRVAHEESKKYGRKIKPQEVAHSAIAFYMGHRLYSKTPNGEENK